VQDRRIHRHKCMTRRIVVRVEASGMLRRCRASGHGLSAGTLVSVAHSLTANMSRLRHEPRRRGWPTTTRARPSPRRTPGAAHESVSPQTHPHVHDDVNMDVNMPPAPLVCTVLQPTHSPSTCTAVVVTRCRPPSSIVVMIKHLSSAPYIVHALDKGHARLFPDTHTHASKHT
jgi:hypothetical protein